MPDFQLNDEFVRELTEAQPRLYGFVFKRLLDPHAASEVLQECNLVLCRKAGDFRPGTNFMAWAFQVAHFQVLAYRQRCSRERLVFDDELLDRFQEEEKVPVEAHTRRLEALEQCLAQLPDDHRRVVVRRYAGGISVQGMAAELSKTPNAISRLLYRSRMALMKCISLKLEEGTA